MAQGLWHQGFSRRTLVGAAIAGGGLALLRPASLLAAAGASDRQLAFDIRREGSSIGDHKVSFNRSGDDLVVDIEIDIAINFAFITVFSYRHRNREVWRDGRLVALDSETNDDGERHWVSARQDEAGLLQVEGSGGAFSVPAGTMSTSYWNPATVQQSQLLDSQHGRLLSVQTQPLGEERLDSGKMARRYRLSGDLNLDLWYTGDGEWAKIEFEARGASVSYARLGIGEGDRASG